MSDRRVLVVGTTPDYIDHITTHFPGRALFLTDPAQRLNSYYPRPEAKSEILADLSKRDLVLDSIATHLKNHDIKLSGICSYDCEWLSLTAFIAAHFDCKYSSEDSVSLVRDKYRSKQVWYEQAVSCPKTELIWSSNQLLDLGERMNGAIVLKPLTGSGSELTFKCNDKYELGIAYYTIAEGLRHRQADPMYLNGLNKTDTDNKRLPVLAEQWIRGREFSADFIVEADNVSIIRVAKKVRSDNRYFGTTQAYIVPGRLPERIGYESFSKRLAHAARALGITHAICMVDFIISKDEVVFLELTPRIGGDCLPPLIKKSGGIDTIGLTLDFAENLPITIPSLNNWKQCVGIRMLAPKSGILSGIDLHKLIDNPSISEIYLKHNVGHEINLPPDDYFSWVLGHLILEVDNDSLINERIRDITSNVTINVEQYSERSLDRFTQNSDRTLQPADPAA